MCDVIIIGGGVIGLSAAFELAEAGLSVRVLEQGQFGQEASWAGAGILPPGNSDWATTREARLRSASCRLWPDWIDRLQELSGVETGFTRCGGLEVRVAEPPTALADEVAAWRAQGVDVESLTAQDLRRRYPALNADIHTAYFLPDLCQVRNPWLLRALQVACAHRGVELFAGHPVMTIDRDGERVHAVHTPAGAFTASEYVIASGAWSRELLRQSGLELPVEPVRGQMVLLESRPLPIGCVVQVGPRYIVPRRDGRILVGSTEEHVGFDKRNTAEAVTELLALAQRLVPPLSQARFERAWSGLRPFLAGGLPLIGRLPALKNAYVATGHYRAGLQMSPITATLLRQLILGQPPLLPLDCDVAAP